MKRKTIISLIILFFASVIYFVFIDKKTVEFEKSKWLTNRAERVQMAADIIDSRMLIGKDTNQVKQILGDLTEIEKGTSGWYYYMGGTPNGFGVSVHVLIVRFDDSMKVIKVDHASAKD